MRILWTTAWYPNRKVAGDGVFIQKHARAVASLHDVAVLMVQTDVAVRGCRVEVETGEEVLPDSAQGRLRHVLVYVPKVRREVPVLTGLLRLMWLMVGYLKGYRHIVRHCWQGRRPECCHVNVLTRAAAIPWLLYKCYGIPYLITEHWSRYGRPGAFPQSAMQLRLARRFVRDAAYVCPVSVNLEQNMKRWELNNPRYVRVGNVVDTEVFRLPAPGKDCEATSCRLLHVSWLRDEAKNLSGILRVLAQLKAECRDWHFDIVGEGNDYAMLHDLALQLGLMGEEPLVSFLPACQGEALAAVMQQHDALVMFSRFENQPVSVLEALSCGLPVVATPVGEIPRMLASRRGLTVPSEDEAQLLSVLRSLVTLHGQTCQATGASMAEAQRLRQARHDYVEQHHSPATIARQFDLLYRQAAQNF